MANAQIDPKDEELIAKNCKELVAHDDRTGKTVSKLVFFMNAESTKVSHETKSSDSKGKKAIEQKWKRIVANIQ